MRAGAACAWEPDLHFRACPRRAVQTAGVWSPHGCGEVEEGELLPFLGSGEGGDGAMSGGVLGTISSFAGNAWCGKSNVVGSAVSSSRKAGLIPKGGVFEAGKALIRVGGSGTETDCACAPRGLVSCTGRRYIASGAPATSTSTATAATASARMR
eukprot:365228-Chlamydomonas_euryale.AAC.36